MRTPLPMAIPAGLDVVFKVDGHTKSWQQVSSNDEGLERFRVEDSSYINVRRQGRWKVIEAEGRDLIADECRIEGGTIAVLSVSR